MSQVVNVAYLMHGSRNVGGGENSIFYLLKNLNRKIYNPIVLYVEKNQIIRKIKQEGISTIHVPINRHIISIYRDKVSYNPIHIIVYLYHLLKSAILIKNIIVDQNIDIIHPHDNLSKIIAGLSAKFAGVKVVAHCRDLLDKLFIEKLLLYFQIIFMDAIIAVSEANKNLFKIGAKISPKVEVIYNGIEFEDYNMKQNIPADLLDNEKSNFVVGIIGLFDQVKGHIYLFEAIKMLVDSGYEKITCLVIGDGRDKNELNNWVKENDLINNIKFLGYRQDIPACLKSIDVLVIPSIQESFPRVALEAMAMEVPVIGSSVGGIPEAVLHKKTGFIVAPKDPSAIQSAIEKFIKSPELIKKMGFAGNRRCRENFSMNTNVKQTERIYNKLSRKNILCAE